MRTTFKFSLLAVFTILLFACSSSKEVSSSSSERWRKLGETTVDYRIDHDAINVTYRDGAFRQLRFAVRGGAINMHRCVVHFENGRTQEIDLRNDFTKGSRSRVVDLAGNKRMIEKITFWHDTKNYSSKKAQVLVWGR